MLLFSTVLPISDRGIVKKGKEISGMATIDMKANGANIRAYIKNKKMKIAEAQAIFGFNTPLAIYKWMRGDAIPAIDNIVILADIFGVGIGDIVVVSRKCAEKSKETKLP